MWTGWREQRNLRSNTGGINPATGIKDISDVTPPVNTPLNNMPHRLLTLDERLKSSPEEYLRKKLAGKERIRIMTAACTFSDAFMLKRPVTCELSMEISLEEMPAQIMKKMIAYKAFILPLLKTGPVRRLVSLGVSMPISVTTSEISPI